MSTASIIIGILSLLAALIGILITLIKLAIDFGKFRGVVETWLKSIKERLKHGDEVMGDLDRRVDNHETRITVLEKVTS